MSAASPGPAAALSMRDVLRIQEFRRLWLAHFISSFGDFVAIFALLAVASFKLHATAVQVTWLTASYMLPTTILGPIAGVFVDRWRLKPTMILSDVIRAVLVMGFVLGTEMWHFYLAIGAIGVVSTAFMPAQQVSIRLLVPREGQLSATALIQQVMFLMRIAGPAAAGVLVSVFGAVICYYADAASFLASAALLWTLPLIRPATTAEPQPHDAKGVRKVWIDFRAGLDFILHHSALLFVVLAMASGLFAVGCFGPLIAIHVRDNLHGGTGIFTTASALIGVGMLAGTTLVRSISHRFTHQQLVFAGLGSLAAFVTGMALTSSVPIALVCCFGVGFSVSAVIIPTQTMIQSETPQHLLGRVGSTVLSTVFGANLTGLLISGELAKLVGVRQVFLTVAIVLAVLIAAGRVFLSHRSGTTMYPVSTEPNT